MTFRKPRIRKFTYYLLAFAVIILNIGNWASSTNPFGQNAVFHAFGMIIHCVAAILGYIVLRIAISNFTEMKQ